MKKQKINPQICLVNNRLVLEALKKMKVGQVAVLGRNSHAGGINRGSRYRFVTKIGKDRFYSEWTNFLFILDDSELTKDTSLMSPSCFNRPSGATLKSIMSYDESIKVHTVLLGVL